MGQLIVHLEMMGWLPEGTLALSHVMMALNYKVMTLGGVGFGGAQQVGLVKKLCVLKVISIVIVFFAESLWINQNVTITISYATY